MSFIVRFWGALLVSGLLFSAIAGAQTQVFDQQVLLERRMTTYRDRLALTDDQSARVQEIQQTHLQSMSKLIAAAQEKVRPRARLKALKDIRALREETSGRMKAVLSAEQMQTYETLMAAQEAELRERIAERREAK